MLATHLRSAKKYPRTTWTRANGSPILSAAGWEAQNTVQEPSLIYESGTWKMWYTGGYTSPAMGYASCTSDPTIAANWTKYASNPVLGQGTVVAGWVAGPNILKVGSTYYAFYYDAAGGGNLKVSTSTDGLTWTTPTTALASNAVAWGTGWANSFVWGSSGAWKMLVELRSTASGTPWRTAYATSTNATPVSGWTVQGTGPISSLILPSGGSQCGGPWLANGGATLNGLYHLFFHAGNGAFTDIYHAHSSDLSTWTISQPPELIANRGTYEPQQAADACVVEVNGASYLFYSGIDNGAPSGYISVATYQRPVADLVLWES